MRELTETVTTLQQQLVRKHERLKLSGKQMITIIQVLKIQLHKNNSIN